MTDALLQTRLDRAATGSGRRFARRWLLAAAGVGVLVGAGAGRSAGAQGAPPATSPAETVPSAESVPAGATPGMATAGTAQTNQGAIANPLPALPVSVWQRAGEPVVGIRFDGVTFSQGDAIFAELQQKSGAPLDPVKVRADLRRLFASGRYRNIAVYGESAAGGLTLVYAGAARYYVGRVEIVGVSQAALSSLLEFATKLEPGTAYTEALMPAALAGIKQSLAENGYYQPTVSVLSKLDRTGQQVNATFTVNTGPQARVGKVTLETAVAAPTGTSSMGALPVSGANSAGGDSAGGGSTSSATGTAATSPATAAATAPAAAAAPGIANLPPVPVPAAQTVKRRDELGVTGLTVPEFRKEGSLNCSRFAALFNKNCDPKVNRDTTGNALSGVRAYYQKQDHLEGTISLQKSTYQDGRRQLDYVFAANRGPIVKVMVNGVKLSKSRTKLLVPVFEEGAVDNDLLNEGAFNIKDYLQQKGYFDVTDEVKLIGKDSGNVEVVYDVQTGKLHKVTDVRLVGNKYFDTDTLESLLQVKKGDAYQRSGKYSAQLVKSDISSIESLYRANGFSHVAVTSGVKDADDARDGKPLKTATIAVTFTIVEGAQQKFGDVDLSGVAASREKIVRGLLSSQSGQPFSLITLSGDRDAVLQYYISNGFDHARIEIAQEPQKDDPTRTDVSLDVTEGQQVFIDQILLSGIAHVKPSVVEAQITVHAGDPLDQAALLQTQRNLYNVALFNEVNAAVQNPSGNAPSKNVLVQLTEAKRWDVTYGFGFEAQTGTPARLPGSVQNGTGTAAQNGKAGVSPRVSLDVSRINLRGTQDSLTLHTTYGLLERVATLSFTNPQLLGHRSLTGIVSGGYSNVQNISTFSSSTLQGDFRVTQKVKRADNFIYDFQYRRVSVDPNSLEITPNLIPQLSEPVTVGGPQITYFHDTRDPSPLNAGKGQYFSVQEFIASSKFGSDTTFNKVDITQSTYYTFGKKKYVFARNLRVGFENFFGTNPNAITTSSQIGVANTACAGALLNLNPTCDPVPLPERLYAGGATSHRGFGINDAGPRDLTTGYPVGGRAVVVNTFELRLPPPTLPIVGDSLSFVVFHDMGNVFQNAGDMFTSIRNFKQPNQASCRNLIGPLLTAFGNTSTAVGNCSFNYYSHAVGLGLRYNTPVGPIRVDFSYNLNPPIYPVFDDYSGAAPYVGQASHFNFFFSIGQSF